MSTNAKIPGPPLAGFVDMFSTEDVYMGASAAKGKGPQRATASTARAAAKIVPGKGKLSGLKRNETVANHARTLKRGRVTAAKAVSAVSRAVNLLKKKPVGKPVVLGAAAVATLSPKAQAALRKQNAAASKSVKASQELAAVARSAKKEAVSLAKALQNQRKVASALRRGAGRTTVGAEDLELLEQYYAAIGAEPDPQNPGSLTDGSADPASALTDVPAGGGIPESPLDFADELPAAPSLDTFIPDMETVGGIPYNGEKGWPRYSKGSYLYFAGPQQNGLGQYGMVWGYDRMGWPSQPNPVRWVKRFGQNPITGNDNWDDGFQSDKAAMDASLANDPRSNPGLVYGPLIGNPAMKDFAGMRFDGKGRPFWFPQEAPEWLTFPLRQAAALAAQAEKKAADAAAKVEAAARAKEAADMAAEQARADAAALLAERQAESEAKVQATQQQSQAAQQEVQAQAELLEQAKIDREKAATEAAQQREVDAMLIAQAKRQQEYLAQHPEVEFAQEQGGDEEGDYPAEGGEYYEEEMPE